MTLVFKKRSMQKKFSPLFEHLNKEEEDKPQENTQHPNSIKRDAMKAKALQKNLENTKDKYIF